MNGLELAKHFYFDCVRPIIAVQAPEVQTSYAAGLIGYGSEVLGNDDEDSRDHEWGPRLILFLDQSNDEATNTRLAQTLNNSLNEQLPSTFMGFPTRFKQNVWGSLVMPNGAGKPHITITTPQKFLESTTGYRGVPTTHREWLVVPEQRLLEFASGEIFHDGLGQVTTLRQQLAYFPTSIWKYRLSYALESLGWELDVISLCAKRGDHLSMHLNIAVTIKRIMQLTFLANRHYCPNDAKWLHRQFSKLPLLVREIEPLLKNVFAAKDEVKIIANIEQALAIIYAHLRTLDELRELPVAMPRAEARGTLTIDSQGTARLILNSIPEPLGQLSIHGASYGAADQWITHEDMLLSPAIMKSFAHVYSTEKPNLR
jgi:hypothetical protein